MLKVTIDNIIYDERKIYERLKSICIDQLSEFFTIHMSFSWMEGYVSNDILFIDKLIQSYQKHKERLNNTEVNRYQHLSILKKELESIDFSGYSKDNQDMKIEYQINLAVKLAIMYKHLLQSFEFVDFDPVKFLYKITSTEYQRNRTGLKIAKDV